MTDIPITAIPGGYKNATDALADLARLAQIQATAYACKARLERALTDVERVAVRCQLERTDALRAVDLFAEIAPLELGLAKDGALGASIREIGESLTAIEVEAQEIVAQFLDGRSS